MSNTQKIPDEENNKAWKSFLNDFATLIEGYPKVETIKQNLSKLRESASLSDRLTYHQKDAIRARCDNYLSNQYGEQRKSNDSRSDYQKKLN